MEVDQLTRDAQHALRRTMEKYSGNCRLILCCEFLSRVIEPLQSRCVAIRVPAPSSDDVRNAVLSVCRKENVNMPEPVLVDLIEKANGNMRRAILMAETATVQSQGGLIQSSQKVRCFEEQAILIMQIPLPEWELYIKETAQIIVKQQNNEILLKVRERLYEVLSRCIPANVLFVVSANIFS